MEILIPVHAPAVAYRECAQWASVRVGADDADPNPLGWATHAGCRKDEKL
jgi:hypothetical protein